MRIARFLRESLHTNPFCDNILDLHVLARSEHGIKIYVEAVPAKYQKESTPMLCGGSSHRISKRIHPNVMWRQFPPNLKKNPPQNYVVVVPAKSQKESTPKLCGGSSRRISKRIHPKIMWRQFPSNLKKNTSQNYVEAVTRIITYESILKNA